MMRTLTLLTLDAQKRSLEKQIAEYTGRIAEEQAERARIAEEQAETYGALAALYLPALTPETVNSCPVPLRERVRDLQLQKVRTEQTLTTRLQNIPWERSGLQESLAACKATLERERHEHATKMEARAQALAAREDYSSAVEELHHADVVANFHERRVRTARKLRETKEPAYRADTVFADLLQRGYGTDAWRPTRADIHLFSQPEYEKEQIRFKPVIGAEEIMRRAYEKAKETVQEQRRRVGNIEHEVERALGVPLAAQELKEAEQAHERTLADIAKLDGEERSDAAELKRLGEPNDPFFRKAYEKVITYLKGLGSAELAEIARATPTQQDDTYVLQLTGLVQTFEASERQEQSCLRTRDGLNTSLADVRSSIAAEKHRIALEEAAEERRERMRQASLPQPSSPSSSPRGHTTTHTFGGGGHKTTHRF